MSTREGTVQAETSKLSQRIAVIQGFYPTTKKELHTTIGFDDGSVYQGTFYTTQANAGRLVIFMENGGSSAAGTLKLGIKLDDDDTEILTLAIIEKTPGHDFCINNFNTTTGSITYGVVKTPKDYNESTCLKLGFPNTRAPEISVNCNAKDTWQEIPEFSPCKRTHSLAKISTLAQRIAAIPTFNYDILSGSGSINVGGLSYQGTFYTIQA